jgi:hypothetical protein
MKFNPILINIFNNLCKDERFTFKNNKGQKRLSDYESIFKSIIYKLKTGCNWNDTFIYGKYSATSVFNYYQNWIKISYFMFYGKQF